MNPRRRALGMVLAFPQGMKLLTALGLVLLGLVPEAHARDRGAKIAPVPVATPAPKTAQPAPADGSGGTAPAGGGKASKVKVYTFGSLDVEGKLKTPQLLYFLNRIKAEFDTSTLDKRSFMPELEKSADDKAL